MSQASQVKHANRLLYDAIADKYDAIDGRRSDALAAWLRRTLSALRATAPGGRLLDLGTGSGFVTKCAHGIFEERFGLDISDKILACNRDAFDGAVSADVDALPFDGRTIDAITCFAALHHFPSFEGVARQVARLLKPGGIFHSDHDMDEAFYQRFRLPLSIYRRLHNASAKYQHASGLITPEIYELAEIHENGVASSAIATLFRDAGFAVDVRYHWYGLTRITDRVFGQRSLPRGFAPLLSITARRS